MYYDPSGHGCDKLEQNKQPETPAGQVGDKGGTSWYNPDGTINYPPNNGAVRKR